MQSRQSNMKVLSVGATGSIGRLVVAQALRQGHRVRALVRDAARARRLPPGTDVVVGDVTRPETLVEAVAGVDAVVFTLGAGRGGAEAVDYGGVRNVLQACGQRPVRIALMTAIGITNRTDAHDWKRRAERLVRASGQPYTIVRPGWFDYNDPDEQLPVLLQGDTRRSGTPRDGAIARSQIAEILVRSLSSAAAARKTFELISSSGSAPDDFDTLFGPLEADREDEPDGVGDIGNLPPDAEPERVRQELDALRARPTSTLTEGTPS